MLLLSSACADRPTADALGSALPDISAESVVLASASGSSASVTAPPATAAFVLRTSFDTRTALFAVEKSFIACTDNCATGTKAVGTAETFVVDRTDMKKVPLFPEGTWRAKYGSMSGVFNEVHHVYFYGKYPGGKLFASVDAPYDRGGYGGVNDLVLGATGWETSSEGHPRSLGCQLVSWVAPGRDESGCSEPRRGLLPELAKAPFRVERIVTLPDGSGVAVLRDGFARTTKLEKKPAPWTEQPGDVMPLSDGSVFVISNATLYRIMPDDSVKVVEAKDGDKLKKLEGVDYVRLHALGLEPWVSFNDAGKQWLAMTPEAGSLTAFLPAPAQRKPREPHDIPQPTKLEDSCTTPFAILSSNQSPHWVFETTLSHFYADPTLQGDATFMSIQRGNGTFFGVQLKSREALKKVEAIASANRIKPKLACLDALAKIPDPTNPPAGVEVYFANMAQKQLLAP